MDNEMKYPYIGKFEETGTETLCLFYKKGFAINLNYNEYVGTDLYNEGVFKNITHEYLQNKKVKIESQEHLEFLYKLVMETGYDESYKDIAFSGNYPWFAIIDGEPNEIQEAIPVFHELEQIKIPLPPKTNKQEPSEWAPQAGDEVQTSVGIGVVKLTPDKLGHYIVDIDDVFCFMSIEQLKKPKAPKEDLRDWMHERIGYGIASGFDCEQITHDLLHHLNITKKPRQQ